MFRYYNQRLIMSYIRYDYTTRAGSAGVFNSIIQSFASNDLLLTNGTCAGRAYFRYFDTTSDQVIEAQGTYFSSAFATDSVNSAPSITDWQSYVTYIVLDFAEQLANTCLDSVKPEQWDSISFSYDFYFSNSDTSDNSIAYGESIHFHNVTLTDIIDNIHSNIIGNDMQTIDINSITTIALDYIPLLAITCSTDYNDCECCTI